MHNPQTAICHLSAVSVMQNIMNNPKLTSVNWLKSQLCRTKCTIPNCQLSTDSSIRFAGQNAQSPTCHLSNICSLCYGAQNAQSQTAIINISAISVTQNSLHNPKLPSVNWLQSQLCRKKCTIPKLSSVNFLQSQIWSKQGTIPKLQSVKYLQSQLCSTQCTIPKL